MKFVQFTLTLLSCMSIFPEHIIAEELSWEMKLAPIFPDRNALIRMVNTKEFSCTGKDKQLLFEFLDSEKEEPPNDLGVLIGLSTTYLLSPCGLNDRNLDKFEMYALRAIKHADQATVLLKSELLHLQEVLAMYYLDSRSTKNDMDMALKILKRLRGHGSRTANYILCRMHAEGRYFSNDVQAKLACNALPLYQSTNPETSFFLGKLYFEGEVFEKDYEKAISYFEKTDYLLSDYYMGMIYYSQIENSSWEDEYEARRLAQHHLEEFLEIPQHHLNGSTEDLVFIARFTLGRLYSHHVIKNRHGAETEALASKYLKEAAGRGNTDAMLAYGELLVKSPRPSKKKGLEGMKWYRSALDNGNMEALKYMGLSYMYGLGVDRDYDEAERLFVRADNQGVSVMADISFMYEASYKVPKTNHFDDRLDGSALYQIGLKFKSRGDEVGMVKYFSLALNHEDLSKPAYKKMRKVALAALYQHHSSKGDVDKALDLLPELGLMDSNKHAFEIGKVLVDKGRIKEGIKLIKLASEENDGRAHYYLGVQYGLGKVVEKDFFNAGKHAFHAKQLSIERADELHDFICNHLSQNYIMDIEKPRVRMTKCPQAHQIVKEQHHVKAEAVSQNDSIGLLEGIAMIIGSAVVLDAIFDSGDSGEKASTSTGDATDCRTKVLQTRIVKCFLSIDYYAPTSSYSWFSPITARCSDHKKKKVCERYLEETLDSQFISLNSDVVYCDTENKKSYWYVLDSVLDRACN